MVDGGDSQQAEFYHIWGIWFSVTDTVGLDEASSAPNSDGTDIVLMIQARIWKYRVTKQGAHSDITRK